MTALKNFPKQLICLIHPPRTIGKLNFSMFHRFYSDKIIVLKYAFIVFSNKIIIFWCIFIVYTSINGLIQGMASIIKSSFFIVFYIDKMITLKYQFKGCFSVSIIIQRCISTCDSNARCTWRKAAERTLYCFFIV